MMGLLLENRHLYPYSQYGPGMRQVPCALNGQSVKTDLLVMDSSSTDNTVVRLAEAGAQVHVMPRFSFNHGATRQLAAELSPDADIIVFMTQDAILASSDSMIRLAGRFGRESQSGTMLIFGKSVW
jgi:rhamnosyltransferase